MSTKDEMIKQVDKMTDDEKIALMTKVITEKNRQKVQTFKDRELIRYAKRQKLDEHDEYLKAVKKFKESL